ncbi:MAG TPA: histidine kinase dimerization/phospho-acceptor domain-containing protein, partial [Chloroflexota bacterium]
MTPPVGPGRFPAGLRSIRVRLTLWYVMLLALVLAVVGVFLYGGLSRSLQQQATDIVLSQADRATAALAKEQGALELSGAVEVLPPGVVVVLYSPEGRRIEVSDTFQAVPDVPDAVRLAQQGQRSVDTARSSSGEWNVATVPFYENGQYAGVVQVVRSTAQTQAALGQLVTLMGIAVPLALALAVGGGLFLASRALGPIDRVTRTAQRIEAEDLSERLNLGQNSDEVGRLAATFDQMLDRLQRAFHRERQFTADASHELRTPLAMLAGRAELALQRERRPTEYRRVLQEVLEDTARMRELVSELLILARADDGREKLATERVALDELALDVTDAMAPLAEAKGVALAVSELQPSTVLGDQTRLHQLVINLVENAIKYTPAAGHVDVAVTNSGNWACLSVADTGIGIPAEHLP